MIKVLNGDRVEVKTAIDGVSLPVLELSTYYGLSGPSRSWVILNKEQTEELIRQLQERLKDL